MDDFERRRVAQGHYELYETLAEDDGRTLASKRDPATLHGNGLISQAMAQTCRECDHITAGHGSGAQTLGADATISAPAGDPIEAPPRRHKGACQRYRSRAGIPEAARASMRWSGCAGERAAPARTPLGLSLASAEQSGTLHGGELGSAMPLRAYRRHGDPGAGRRPANRLGGSNAGCGPQKAA